MSNFVQEFEEDEQLQSSTTIVSQSSNGSLSHAENGVDDPDAEVVALSPRTLMATNRYICEVCHKGFQRDQNLQLHKRGHNLPWKLKQRTSTQVKKRVYVCPEPNCVHHDPSRALGDLTGIKKHFCRKHGEKKWKCDKCSKRYAVQSDWKAHTKICGTREYRCDCSTIFSRKDSFVTHRAFCDALTEESLKVNQNQAQELFTSSMPSSDSGSNKMMNLSISTENMDNSLIPLSLSSAGVMITSNLDSILNPRMTRTGLSSVGGSNASLLLPNGSSYTSATALLQKAAEMGAKISDNTIAPILLKGFSGYSNSNIVSSGSVQDGSAMINTNIGLISGGSNGLYLGDQATFDKILEPETGNLRQSTAYNVSQAAFFGQSSHFLHHPETENGKMTLDFLGVELAGNSGVGRKRNYDGNIMGLGYSNGQQSLHNLHSDW
ncbi:hypothetical protein EZV62_024871 [Acer yangbiense]|uniref:C2H2-type domain-containing protein n=1 Tax=Acer yangbiense TaxID=1000413 RepID=A0A5C7GY61_9ROSI|nr:hypothetical protein EZV62_024871 [Acer yangbiense]